MCVCVCVCVCVLMGVCGVHIYSTFFAFFQARRVVAMASSHDIMVIPHGSSVYSYHLQFAFTNCPLAEYINLSPQVRAGQAPLDSEHQSTLTQPLTSSPMCEVKVCE